MSELVADLLREGQEHLQNYECDQALALFDLAISKSPDNSEAHFGRFESLAENYHASSDERARTAAFDSFCVGLRSSKSNPYFPVEFSATDLIGVGGMGYVFKVARIPKHAPKIPQGALALKTLKSRFCVNRHAIASFNDEVRKVAAIQHRNVVRYIENDCHLVGMKGLYRPYVVMEFIDGKTLRQLLRDPSQSIRKGDIDRALGIVLEICDGMTAAHTRAEPIAHLDLKPENVMWDSTNNCWRVIDFGMALLRHNRSMFETKYFLATPYYSAPEVFSEKGGSPRSDVFSIGKILVELCSGAEAVIDHRKAEGLTRSDPDLGYLLDTCIEQNPKLRYMTAAELASEVRNLQRTRALAAQIAAYKNKAWIFVAATLKLLSVPIHPTEHAVETYSLDAGDSPRGVAKYYFKPLMAPLMLGVVLLAALAGISIPVFAIELRGVLFGDHSAEVGQELGFRAEFLPTFLVAFSFALLAYVYFQNIVRAGIGIITRISQQVFVKSMGFIYSLPILVAVGLPDWWAFCSAFGVTLVAISNFILWNSYRRFRNYVGGRNTEERNWLRTTLLGWAIGATVYAGSLFALGFVLVWLRETVGAQQGVFAVELLCAVFVSTLNVYVMVARTSGSFGGRIRAGLLWEEKIRARA